LSTHEKICPPTEILVQKMSTHENSALNGLYFFDFIFRIKKLNFLIFPEELLDFPIEDIFDFLIEEFY